MQLQRLPLVGQEAIGIRNPLPMWLVPITIPVNQHIAKTVANFLSVIIRYHWKIPGKVQEKRPCFFVFPSLGWFQRKNLVVGEPPMISNWLSASFCSIMLILAQQSSDARLFCSPLHLTWCLNEWPFPPPTAVFFQARYTPKHQILKCPQHTRQSLSIGIGWDSGYSSREPKEDG